MFENEGTKKGCRTVVLRAAHDSPFTDGALALGTACDYNFPNHFRLDRWPKGNPSFVFHNLMSLVQISLQPSHEIIRVFPTRSISKPLGSAIRICLVLSSTASICLNSMLNLNPFNSFTRL